jgi:4-alpha-glucanotransferase
MSLDPVLAELAAAHGVAAYFHDWRGGEKQVSARAVISVLAALGVDASTPDAASDALARVYGRRWHEMLPTYLVVRGGTAATVAVHVPHGDPVAVDLEIEGGGRIPLAQLMIWVDPRDVDGELIGEATFQIPDDVPLGYHHLHAQSAQRSAKAQLIVVPDQLEVPPGRHWGFMVQLYAVRSRASWAMGDLRDLSDLVTWSGRDLGADFVLVNPLHAAGPIAPMEPSPYYPSSRRFVNPIYLRVDDVPEVALLPADDVDAVAQVLRDRNVLDEDLDRDAVWSAKRQILERAFAARNVAARRDEFAQFVAAEGDALRDFATWSALVDRHGAAQHEWVTELRDPRSATVAAFRDAESQLVEFHAWLQFLCSEQLTAVQAAARAAGMSIGVMNDLAVGVSGEGADAWAFQSALAPGVVLGAPADMYNQQGQSWNLPPWRPDALAAAQFAPFRDLVRASLRHGGGLRIDHIIGLFRQWWVPEGASPADGTYVRFDHEAMVGIVMLEASRAGAVLIGEDLGNVEPWVRDYLRGRGVYGTSILWFEHDDAGHPHAPELWRELCLASATTHDLPPTAGYLTGEHVELRHELGLLERPVDEERATDEAARLGWLQALDSMGLLDADILPAIVTVAEPATMSPRRDNFRARVEPHVDRIVEALHAYLAATPARLIGIYLPDVVGDRRPINQPGTVDEYPNWRVPMADEKQRPVLLEEVMASPAAARLARLVGGSDTGTSQAGQGEPNTWQNGEPA